MSTGSLKGSFDFSTGPRVDNGGGGCCLLMDAMEVLLIIIYLFECLVSTLSALTRLTIGRLHFRRGRIAHEIPLPRAGDLGQDVNCVRLQNHEVRGAYMLRTQVDLGILFERELLLLPGRGLGRDQDLANVRHLLHRLFLI